MSGVLSAETYPLVKRSPSRIMCHVISNIYVREIFVLREATNAKQPNLKLIEMPKTGLANLKGPLF